jgi:hypothetical protein
MMPVTDPETVGETTVWREGETTKSPGCDQRNHRRVGCHTDSHDLYLDSWVGGGIVDEDLAMNGFEVRNNSLGEFSRTHSSQPKNKAESE